MKKTQKKILGFFGLMVVAGMTIIAASLPSPEALATSSATESIVVTVTAPDTPDVNITNPASGSILVNPNQAISFNYSEVNDVLVTLEKEMPSGTPQVYNIFSTNASLAPGSNSVGVDLSEPQYGYGEYTVRIRGVGVNRIDEDSRRFSYVPVKAEVEEDDQTGKVYTTLEYDDNSADLDHFLINVHDKNGNRIDVLSGIIVKKGESKKVELKFAENKIPAGEYIVSVMAYDINDIEVYDYFDRVFFYDPIAVPNTGGLFAGLNISKSDYLITGLIIFFLVGIFGIMFIAKNKSKR